MAGAFLDPRGGRAPQGGVLGVLYGKFGFETEGLLKRCALRDGVFVDALAMARLHPAPPAIVPRAAV